MVGSFWIYGLSSTMTKFHMKSVMGWSNIAYLCTYIILTIIIFLCKLILNNFIDLLLSKWCLSSISYCMAVSSLYFFQYPTRKSNVTAVQYLLPGYREIMHEYVVFREGPLGHPQQWRVVVGVTDGQDQQRRNVERIRHQRHHSLKHTSTHTHTHHE